MDETEKYIDSIRRNHNGLYHKTGVSGLFLINFITILERNRVCGYTFRERKLGEGRQAAMRKKERQDQIEERLRREKRVLIKELSRDLSVSLITLRRDFDEMEQRGLLKKVYGGAEYRNRDRGILSEHHYYRKRTLEHLDEKERIGFKAAEMIKDGETVFVGIGTTCLQVARKIRDLGRHVTVVTNSLPVLGELADTGLSLCSLGGTLKEREFALLGTPAIDALRYYSIDKAFVGAGGISLEYGLMNHSRESAEFCAAVIQRAGKTVLVADSSKYDKNSLSVICALNRINAVVTDSGIPERYREEFSRNHTKIVLCEERFSNVY